MIGKNLKQIRTQKGLSQREFADKLEVSKSTVASWEIERTEPNMAMLYKIAEVLNVSPAEIIGAKPPTTNAVELSKGDQVILNMIHEISDQERSEILNRLFEMLNRH